MEIAVAKVLELIEHLRMLDAENGEGDAQDADAKDVITIDGLRVEYADGFGLARPSNTTSVIVLRFEADNEAAIKRIQNDFKRVIHEQAPDLALPF
jgi:phosphomannomutase/phosphoglucomutase